MGELKPCPFCGGEANIRMMERHNRRVWYGCCRKCNARTEGYCEPIDLDGYFNPYNEITKSVCSAAEEWNRRASDGEEAQEAVE